MSFAGASSLLARLKPRLHGEPKRRIDKHARAYAEDESRRRYRFWLACALTSLWVALLLFLVAYAVIEGEAAMAQLDDLSLVAAYSLSP